MDGDLFMVMDTPLRKGNSECEWEKAEKIHNIESIMLDMLIIYNGNCTEWRAIWSEIDL